MVFSQGKQFNCLMRGSDQLFLVFSFQTALGNVSLYCSSLSWWPCLVLWILTH